MLSTLFCGSRIPYVDKFGSHNIFPVTLLCAANRCSENTENERSDSKKCSFSIYQEVKNDTRTYVDNYVEIVDFS